MCCAGAASRRSSSRVPTRTGSCAASACRSGSWIARPSAASRCPTSSGRCRSTRSQPVQPPPGHDGWFPRAGYPDMLAMPDLETARIVPWHDRTALLLCDFVDRDGPRHPAVAPRRPALRGRARSGHGHRADRRDRARVLCAARDAAVGADQAAVAAAGGRGAPERLRRGGGLAARGLRRCGARDAAGVRPRGGGVRAGGGSGPVRDHRARRSGAPRGRRGVPAQERGEGDRGASRAAGHVHGQAALRLAGQLVPPAHQPARRRARRDAPLPRRPAGGDGRAVRDLRPHAELLPAPDPLLVGGHHRHLERRQPLRRRAGHRRRRRHRPGGAPPGRRRRQPVPRRRRRARRGLDGVRRACAPPPPVGGDVYALADGAAPALPRRWARPPTCSSAARWPASGWATTSSSTAWRCAGPSSRRSPPRSPTGRPRATWRRCR